MADMFYSVYQLYIFLIEFVHMMAQETVDILCEILTPPLKGWDNSSSLLH